MTSFKLRTLLVPWVISIAVITGCGKQDSTAWDDETNSPTGGTGEMEKAYPEQPSPPPEPSLNREEPLQPGNETYGAPQPAPAEE